jgi:hypothetical protein
VAANGALFTDCALAKNHSKPPPICGGFFMKQHCLTSQGAYRTIIYTPFWAENAIF